MILTVTLNTALDLTYTVPETVPRGTNRVEHVESRAGGKGINVSRILRQLGLTTMILGFAGGHNGASIADNLLEAKLNADLVVTRQESRRTVAIYPTRRGQTTIYCEAGPRVYPDEWEQLKQRYQRALGAAKVVVLSGSLPAGIPPNAYDVLGQLARRLAIPVVLDASGPALNAGLRSLPDVVKPNFDELKDWAGRQTLTNRDLLSTIERMRSRGARAVVASLGRKGLVAVAPEGRWRAKATFVSGNPVGAGDAVVAALAAGIAANEAWPERIRKAAALSAASVKSLAAGTFDVSLYAAYLRSVAVREV